MEFVRGQIEEENYVMEEKCNFRVTRFDSYNFSHIIIVTVIRKLAKSKIVPSL